MSSVDTKTCKAKLGYRTFSDDESRVLPFLNPKVVFDKSTNRYTFDDNSCAVPNDSMSHFEINNGCVYTPKPDIYDPKSTPTVPVYMENLSGDKYPEGCGLSIDGQFNYNLKNMQYSLDYDYIQKIYEREQKIKKLKAEIHQLHIDNYNLNRYKRALEYGIDLADARIKSMTDWLDSYSKSGWLKMFNDSKKAYKEWVGKYNLKADDINKYIQKCNTDLSCAFIFEHCDFGGTVKVLKMDPSEKQQEFTDLGSLRGVVSSVKVPPGLKLYLFDENGNWFWAANYITGTRNWGYDGTCLVDFDFNDKAIRAVLQRLDKFDYRWRKMRVEPEKQDRFLYWYDVFED